MSREPNALLTPNRPNGGQRCPAAPSWIKQCGAGAAKRSAAELDYFASRGMRASAGENNCGPGLESLWLSFRFKASTGYWVFGTDLCVWRWKPWWPLFANCHLNWNWLRGSRDSRWANSHLSTLPRPAR